MKSKVFRNSAQLTTEFWKLCREFCRLSKNYRRQSLKRGPHINTRVVFQLKRECHTLTSTMDARVAFYDKRDSRAAPQNTSA